jgi:hypothetical protein
MGGWIVYYMILEINGLRCLQILYLILLLQLNKEKIPSTQEGQVYSVLLNFDAL